MATTAAGTETATVRVWSTRSDAAATRAGASPRFSRLTMEDRRRWG